MDKRLKLSDDDAIAMCRERLRMNTPYAVLAEKYGVSVRTVQGICQGRSRNLMYRYAYNIEVNGGPPMPPVVRKDNRKKLSDDTAIVMCIERLQGRTLAELCAKYKISYTTCHLICRGISRPEAMRRAQREVDRANGKLPAPQKETDPS